MKVYEADGSPEFREFCAQRDSAMGHFRANQTKNFYVDPRQGHDDFLMSLALLVKAAEPEIPEEMVQGATVEEI